MAVTHDSTVRNAMANAVVASIDAGSGAGTLEFLTSGDVVVATLTFSSTSFPAASGGTATANAITREENASGATIAKFRMKDSDGNAAGWLGSVTGEGGGGDIELSTLTPAAGEPVEIDSLVYNAAP